LVEEVPPVHLLAAVGVSSEHDVLDVATGSGNVALRAARSGARVIGLDLTPELLDVAGSRASLLPRPPLSFRCDLSGSHAAELAEVAAVRPG